MRLKNKTALITGGNSGIGLATAKAFIAEGARVAITGRNRATLDAALKELGPNAIAVQADATDIAATEQARSEEHTSELQSLMRISYAVFCLKKNKNNN